MDERLYAQILSTVEALVVLLDKNARIIAFNRACQELTGLSETEACSRHVWDLVPEADRPTTRDVFHRLRSTDAKPSHHENHWLDREGKPRLIAWSNSALVDEATGDRLIIGTGIDITDQRQAEAEARDRELRLSAILDTAADGIVTIDQHGKILSFNNAAEGIFGYTEEELLGKNVGELMPSPDKEKHDNYIARYLRGGKARIIGIGREVLARRKGGEIFPIDLAVSEVRTGTQLLFTGIIRDISARQSAENQLRTAQFEHTQLERVAIAGELAAVVAHEVRTPLNALSINIQLAERLLRRGGREAEAKVREIVSSLRAEIQRINQLIEEFLSGVRRPRTRMQTLDIPRAIREATRFVEQQALRQGVTIEHRFHRPTAGLLPIDTAEQDSSAPRSEPPTVRGDPAEFRQVLLNLLLNALQAMPQGGRITLTTQLDGKHFVLGVQDSGPGIPPEQLSTIFKPFFTTKRTGTGLGLAICERIMRTMGGGIRVTSTPKRGTRFDLTLPLARAG